MQKRNYLYISAALLILIVALGFLNSHDPTTDSSSNQLNYNPSQSTTDAYDIENDTAPSNDTASFKEESDVVPVHPIDCRPYLGFDRYRTFQSFAINPKNSNEMYVSIEYKGIWKSSDGGETWKLASKGIKAWPRKDNTSMPCYGQSFHLYIDPINTNKIMITSATTGSMSDIESSVGGIWESTDAGESWHQLFNEGMNAYTAYMTTDPRDSNTIYVASAALPDSSNEQDYDKLLLTKGVVYKTTNNGDTWEELPTGLVHSLRTSGIFIDQKNPNHLLLPTAGIPVGNDPNKKALSEQWGILETKDAGNTWRKVEALPSDFRLIRMMDVSPTNFNNWFFTGDSADEERRFYTTDGGASVNTVETPVNFARYDPHDPSGMRLLGFSIYTQPDDLFESKDGGKSWRTIGKLPKEASNEERVSNIVFDPKDNGVIYLNGDMGRVWRSNDNGNTWKLMLSVEMLD